MHGRIEPPSPSYTVTGPVLDLATPVVNPRPGTPTTERVALEGIFVASAAAVASSWRGLVVAALGCETLFSAVSFADY